MFRFSIRDVLWLTMVVALAVGWWLSHRSMAARIAEHVMRAEQLEGNLSAAKEEAVAWRAVAVSRSEP